MKLGLILTTRCNASCSHCSTSCGPRRTESLPRAKIFSLMEEAAALAAGQPLEFPLSGGEPFLDFELLLAIAAYGRQLGASVTCVTNGYWASSAVQARQRLSAVKEAGLAALAVSTGRFHQQFVKLERVERVLGAARDVGLRCTLKYVRTGSDPQDEAAVAAWARAAGADEVQDFSVLPYLSAGARLPEAEYLRSPGLPEGRCPVPIITVREDGEAFTCCSPGALTDLLALGNTQQRSLAQIHDRYYLGGTQQLLREHGPVHFARAAQAQGQGHRLREGYASICDLCAHIASDPALAQVAAEVSQDFEQRQMEALLATLTVSQPPAAG